MQPDKKEKNYEGFECRECGCRHFIIGHTKKIKNAVIRYRYCRYCGKGITTRERALM